MSWGQGAVKDDHGPMTVGPFLSEEETGSRGLADTGVLKSSRKRSIGLDRPVTRSDCAFEKDHAGQ